MMRNISVFLLILLATVALALPAHAARRKKSSHILSGATIGIRQHVDHPSYPQLPFADGDTSYLLAYEYHENQAFWQLGLEYSATGSATGDVAEAEGIYTPQIHLIFKDGMFWGGAGLMKSYISNPELDKGWTGIYWQIQLGIHLPVSTSLDLRASAFYVFDDWGDLGEFDMDEVEIGGSIAYMF